MNVFSASVLTTCALSLLSASSAHAGPVTFEFAGTVSLVVDGNGFLGDGVAVGDPFSASFTFESTTPDDAPGDPVIGRYLNSLTDVSGFMGSIRFSEPFGDRNRIVVGNNLSGSGRDEYRVETGIDLGGADAVFRLILAGGTGFEDDSLPLFPLDVDLFGTALFDIFSEEGAFRGAAGGTITSFTPEPSSLLLTALACLGLVKRPRGSTARPYFGDGLLSRYVEVLTGRACSGVPSEGGCGAGVSE